jgi:hypothetical protein
VVNDHGQGAALILPGARAWYSFPQWITIRRAPFFIHFKKNARYDRFYYPVIPVLSGHIRSLNSVHVFEID